MNVSYSNGYTPKCWWLITIGFYFSLTQSPVRGHSPPSNDSRNQIKESLSSSTYDFLDSQGSDLEKLENAESHRALMARSGSGDCDLCWSGLIPIAIPAREFEKCCLHEGTGRKEINLFKVCQSLPQD